MKILLEIWFIDLEKKLIQILLLQLKIWGI